MDNQYFDESPDKTTGFYIAIIVLLIMSFLGFGIDVTEFQQRHEIKIPNWYFIIILIIDILIVLGLVLIFFYRKIGVYLFPLAVMLHLYIHEFYLSTLLYSDVFNLFAFITLGLVMIIPKWKFFK